MKELTQIPQNLPYSPGLLRKLFSQTSGDSLASLTEISETMAQDQGLTAKILTMANSAFYGLQAKVTTVSRAMVVLGLKEVRTMVLLIGIKALTKNMVDPDLLNLREYWRHQIITAAAAGPIAARAGVNSEDMFTAALLHDLGKLLTALHRPKDWQAVSSLAASENIPHAMAEEQHWGLEIFKGNMRY
ncbi:MAG: HDOD domain-containing protein [Thermodesulfobacteriota bacterium]|nr:HDOD domain-containing protein [Thermodesulfobacteriota bacterium]